MENSQTLEYELDMMPMLELVWGKGFITPGGEGNVDRIVAGVDLSGKQVLEIGSGLGGGTMVLASKYGASVIGLDIEAPLVERATQYAEDAGLTRQIEFRHVTAGSFPVDDSSVDYIYTSGVLCHFDDKPAAFSDAYRVLKPGGMILGYDWLKGPGALSDKMHDWMAAAGLTLYPDTLESYARFLADSGFEDISYKDASDWYLLRACEEYEQMTGPLFNKMASLANTEARDQFIEEWRTMLVVLNTGELKSGYFSGLKQ